MIDRDITGVQTRCQNGGVKKKTSKQCCCEQFIKLCLDCYTCLLFYGNISTVYCDILKDTFFDRTTWTSHKCKERTMYYY